jgi:hypothetical protein
LSAWLTLVIIACCDQYIVRVQTGDRAYYKLRLARTNAKLVGARAKKAAEAAAEEAAKAK